LIAFFITRPVMVCMLLLGGCMLGVVSYQRLPVELIPFAELPMLTVRVQSQQESDPQYLERQVVIPLESAIAGLAGIERIESYIEQQSATLFVFYARGSDQKYAFLKLQERVESARANFSDEFWVQVFKIDTEQMATRFMSLEARGKGTLDQIRHVLDEKVVADLERLDGMANVAVFGGRQRLVEVLLNEDVMHSYGLTLSSVNARISQASSARQYLGEVYDGRQRLFVNLASDFDSLEELEETIIRPEDGLRLGQIATVLDGSAIGESIARVNGMEAVSITLVSDREVNLLELSQAARETIAQLNLSLVADGVELVIQRDAAEVIEDNIGDIKSLAVVGALLAVGVLWVFLRNLSLVAIVAAAVPISVLIAMNLLYALDVTLNTLSMVGIAIAVGMLLDNSIVVLESIYRQVARGGEIHAAVVTGVSQVWRAVSAATLTTVCVFLPFVFSENFLVGILGRQVGVSIISTLLVSLVVALLLIPVFTYRLFSRAGAVSDGTFNTVSQRHRLMQVYSLLLKSCMRFPARTVVVAVTALFASVLLSLALSIDSSEEVELTTFDMYATMPAGTTLALADREAQQMDARVADIAELEERHFDIQADDLHLTFELKEGYQEMARRTLGMIKGDIIERLRTGFPNLNFSFDQPSTGRYQGGGGNAGAGRAFQRLLGIGGGTERVVLRGNNLELMQTVADDIRYNLGRLPGVAHARPGVSKGQPEIELAVDKAAMAYFAVAPDAIASGLSDFQNQLSSQARLQRGADQIDVVLSSTGHPPRQVEDLRQLQVTTQAGGAVPLMYLADLRYASGYGGINRVNQQKEVAIGYGFERQVTGSKELLEGTRAAVDRLVADFRLPAGMSIEVEHDEADLADFYFLIGATILLIYMILAAVFESLVAPISMMITLPLAATGALWGLILTGDTIYNANALVGFLILLGVVVNNGIILIDYARLLQRQGYRLSRALLAAGQVRVRPILITALSTILAMLPLAMGHAEYVAQIGAPFATAVIGGLVTGTVFTLVLVPTVYFGLATTVAWLRQLSWTIKLTQIAALAAGAWMIHKNADSILWQAAAGITLVGLVPGLTWFVQTSLRHSRADPIPADVPLSISIRNVVKVYDAPGRFARQWGRGARQQQRHRDLYGDGGDWAALVWRLPLLAFHGYLTYYYQQNAIWIAIFSVAIYAHALNLASAWLPAADGFVRRATRLVYHLGYWLGPVPHLFWFYRMWDDPAPVATVGGLWYVAAAINRGVRRLHGGGVNVDAITGRFRRSRRAFYLMVRAIPVIGKRKKPFVALRRVSLEIESGMFGLIGPNGAGKTTLMRIICGILDQSLGKVRINDIDLSQRREELQSLIGYLPQEFGTYESLTARQFLDYQALLKGKWDTDERHRVLDEALASVHLEDSADKKIGGFSGGMKQRVGIAQTLLRLPRILLVDEPTAGLDPRERIRFRNLLAELGRDRAVIFSTHIIEDISSSCNRLAVLGDGEVRFHGTPREMVELTRGVVWQAHVSEPHFEELRGHARIVHHMRDGDSIRVRMLSQSQPLTGAEAVTPTLEDSYLWLLDKAEA